MAQEVDNAEEHGTAEPDEAPPRRLRRWAVRGAAGLGAGIAVAVLVAWFARERIARSVIESQLTSQGLPATYEIDHIGPGLEVLSNIRIGRPERPDLTIERAAVTIVYRFGLPRIGTVTLDKARLYGTYTHGKLSFGSLDKLLFGGKKRKVSLPAFNLDLDDARALLATDYGNVGIKAGGHGRLSDGFTGELAAIAPGLDLPGCKIGKATLYGKLSVADGKPGLEGPLRLAGLSCPGSRIALGDSIVSFDTRLDKGLDGASADLRLRGRLPSYGSAKAETLAVDGRLAWRGGELTGKLAGNAGGVASPRLDVALVEAKGFLRTHDGMARVEFNGSLDGRGLRQGPALGAVLASAGKGTQGTLFGPMIASVRSAIERERPDSRLRADFDVRRNGSAIGVFVPQASLAGSSGRTLVSLSHFSFSAGGPGQRAPSIAGNFTTGGRGLPHLSGRMEQSGARGPVLRLTMAPFRAGDGQLALPRMMIAQAHDGSIGFAGEARMSGAIPGGRADGLDVPLDGSWGSNGELAVLRHCADVRFDRLALGGMEIDKRDVQVCPPHGGAVVRSGAAGLRIAVRVPSLDLAGHSGESPLRLTSGPIGFAWPGAVTAQAVDFALGPEGNATHFHLKDLKAQAGKDFEGTFDGVDAKLAAVPLNVANAAGDWRFADGKLSISGASLDVSDSASPARFDRLEAKDATLTLANDRIGAEAVLREPKSGREVVRATIRHDLASAVGHADLHVDGLTFDKKLQPDAITPLTYGMIANVKGTVTGQGEVDWHGDKVTSRGRFASDGLDLAAPFGPVQGLKGAIVFTDLLNFVTAPGQTFTVASINPGVEVNDGTVTLALQPGQVLRLDDAHWPFMGGTLRLEPTVLHLGVEEPRRYVLDIKGLDAAKFLEKMQFGNLSASGTFDGQFPLVFTRDGGQIEGGKLVSRPPGGNVSYVGQLSYKNLSMMGNFAFDALKSLDYKRMTIDMHGPLAGEIITSVGLDGIKQGKGAKRNFITREIGKLPMRFLVNIRAPFFALVSNMKSLYDPSYIQDPRTLGLIDAKGRPIGQPAQATQTLTKAPPNIQTPASGNKP